MSLRNVLRGSITGLGLIVTTSLVPGQIGSAPLPAPKSVTDQLGVTNATAQDLLLPWTVGQAFEVKVYLDGAQRTLQLRPHDVRSPDFQLLVDDGNTLRQIPTPQSVTYRGNVAGDSTSEVAAALVDGQLEAAIHVTGATYYIEPANKVVPGLQNAAHFVYSAADMIGAPCGTPNTSIDNVVQPAGVKLLKSTAATVKVLKVCEIAIDATNRFYKINNSSTTNTQNAVTSMINAIDLIYSRDVEITYLVTTIIVRTTAVYTTNGASALLNQFQNRWNTQHSGVVRDIAHMFTGASSSGVAGISNLGTICRKNSAYGVTWYYSFGTRVSVAAHELGHSWSAQHCDGINPCNIMCSTVGRCSRNGTSFAPVSINRITQFKNSRNCLSNPIPPNPPLLLSINPNNVASHLSPTMSIFGSDLSMVTALTAGNIPITNFTVVDNTQIDFNLPDPFEINSHPIVATSAAGSSNPIFISVAGNHPSMLEVPVIHPRGTQLPYRAYTDRNWNVIYLFSASNAPSAFPGLVSLGIGNGFTDLTQLVLLPADSAGVAEVQLMMPNGIPPGSLYWQLVTFDPNNITTPLEVSNAAQSIVF